jgi:hypothetical protein
VAWRGGDLDAPADGVDAVADVREAGARWGDGWVEAAPGIVNAERELVPVASQVDRYRRVAAGSGFTASRVIARRWSSVAGDAVSGCLALAWRAMSVLASWSDGAARRAIGAFVERAVSDVPVEERVAVFDNDGTLWCEKPLPIQADFILRRLFEMAQADPQLRDRQPWKAAHERDYG